MNKERPIYCSLSGHHFQEPNHSCLFMLNRETYGDSMAIRAICATHNGGQAIISLSVNANLGEIEGKPARLQESEVED